MTRCAYIFIVIFSRLITIKQLNVPGSKEIQILLKQSYIRVEFTKIKWYLKTQLKVFQ